MIEYLDYFREFNLFSVCLRLTLAVAMGGILGLERGAKRRPAGFRTYMLISLGAALTMVLSQYETVMMATCWAELSADVGVRADVSRFAAQVINGVGFLGAGTIFISRHRDMKGVTTAAGLWASACMGLAVGAGFYECAVPASLMMFCCVRFLPWVEELIVTKIRNMNVYIEFTSLDEVGNVINLLKERNIHIHEIDVEESSESSMRQPSAILYIRFPVPQSHLEVLSAIRGLNGILTVHEI